MEIKGKITIFPEKRKNENGEFIVCKGTISSKDQDGKYLNKSVEVKFDKDHFPRAKVNTLNPDYCYQLEVEKGYLVVDGYTMAVHITWCRGVYGKSVVVSRCHVPHTVVFYQETLVKPFYQSFVLLTLLGIYLFICFNAIGGMGNSGNKSVRRCSIPMARSSEMKLLSVIF